MKKNIKILSFVVIICTIASVIIIAQRRTGDETIPAAQISEGIQTFSKLVNEQNAQSFGLQNAEQVKSLRAGKQFKKYMIGLDDIKKYKAGEDVEPLIKELPSVEVSLTDANGKVLTAIEFTKNKDKWQASGFGSTPDMKVLFNDREMLPDSVIDNGRLVRIPALRTNFIALSTPSGLNFVIVEDNESLEMRRGAMISASDAIARLAPVANQYNGLPD